MCTGGEVSMTATNRITVRLPIDLNNILSDKATQLGVSKNSLVLHMLWKAVEEKNSKH